MLRVAVLGAGRIGKIHAANVAGNPKAKLVTIADPYGTAARNLADHLGCEASLDPITAIDSGGIFRDMVIHDFDMARWLLGEEPIEVMAMASRLVDSGLAELDDFDTVMVQMRTASGRQCHINCCREAVYGYDQRMEIFGSTGMLLNENLRPTTVRRWGKTETEVRDPLLNFFLERYAEAYKTEFDQFVDALENGSPMPTTPHDGRQALRLADCALESALTGRAVKV
jgi:myo-inositol 2-dehydrogenase/D-chiro-inositol 1-dehydrogenase